MSVLQPLASVAPVRIQTGRYRWGDRGESAVTSYISRHLAVFSPPHVTITSRLNLQWYRKYEFCSAPATLEVCKSSKDASGYKDNQDPISFTRILATTTKFSYSCWNCQTSKQCSADFQCTINEFLRSNVWG